jgi:hypothetical protein
MWVLDLIFGKNIVKKDDFFGELKSDKTRKKNINKSLTWSFDKRIGQFKKDTYIILEGNYNDINSTQKEQLRSFIDQFDTIYSLEIDKLIESDNTYKLYENWRNEYYLSFISPLNDSNTSFDLNFEPIDEDNHEGYFNIELIRGSLKNISTL